MVSQILAHRLVISRTLVLSSIQTFVPIRATCIRRGGALLLPDIKIRTAVCRLDIRIRMLVCRRRRRDSLIRTSCVSRRDTSRICAGCRDISSSRTSDPIRRRGSNNRRTGGRRAVTSRTRGVVWTPELCMRRAMFPGPRAGTFQCLLTGRACNSSSSISSSSNNSCSSSSGRRVRRLIIRSITIRRCSCRCRYPYCCSQHTIEPERLGRGGPC